MLERLYEADAGGLQDVELCDEVGLRLYERCRSFVLVSAHEVECPSCGVVFVVEPMGESPCPGDACGWTTTASGYRGSLRNHYAHAGRAIDAIERFYRGYPGARGYREKLLLIDALIHSFHVDEARAPVKSVASKLLEGNKHEVVRFLDRLSAVDANTKERWRRTASGTLHGRLLERPDRT